MWRNRSEEWERRKSYLVRSLFEDLPRLSPISETDELKLPSAEASSRPYSPLPDLIIEREKNRHDEPEEYYQLLEKKMLKLYRKLFYDVEYESNSEDDSCTKIIEFDDTEADFENYISKDEYFSSKSTEVSTSKTNSSNSSVLNEAAISSDLDVSEYSDLDFEFLKPLFKINQLAELENLDQPTHDIIIAHYKLEDIGPGPQVSPTHTDRSLIIKHRQYRKKSLQEYETSPELQISEKLAETQARNNQDLTSSNVEVDTDESSEIETLRRDKCDSKSLGSTPYDVVSSEKSLTPVIEMEKEMSLMENITQSDESITVPVRDTGTGLESDEVQEMAMNTLQHPQNSEKSNSSSLKRVSSDSWSDIAEDAPSKMKKYVTKEIQTSPLPDAEIFWEDLRSNFFLGTPLVRNLCNCENHV
ncbi:unnamed protein product [Parnassius mnemosyne]|uniref:Uncharacterized protein n=1 Tax=Parnassius mnemosyne TaxID=213953 RepID=A0AAV1M6H8_9NEOP